MQGRLVAVYLCAVSKERVGRIGRVGCFIQASSVQAFSAAISAWLTASHPNSEVKQVRAGVVLRWGTTREGPVLRFLFLLCFATQLARKARFRTNSCGSRVAAQHERARRPLVSAPPPPPRCPPADPTTVHGLRNGDRPGEGTLPGLENGEVGAWGTVTQNQRALSHERE